MWQKNYKVNFKIEDMKNCKVEKFVNLGVNLKKKFRKIMDSFISTWHSSTFSTWAKKSKSIVLVRPLNSERIRYLGTNMGELCWVCIFSLQARDFLKVHWFLNISWGLNMKRRLLILSLSVTVQPNLNYNFLKIFLNCFGGDNSPCLYAYSQ